MARRLTQIDIARIANVSQATVSRVLTGDERVDGETRSRVLDLARLHDYTPDARARSLRNSHTHLIGLVIRRSPGALDDDPFFASLVASIIGFLSDTPYHLCLDVVQTEQTERAVYEQMLRSRRVDGLLLVEPEGHDERIQRLQSDRFPCVIIGNPPGQTGLWSVDNDNMQAAELACRHLLSEGYDSVGFLGGPAGVAVSEDRIAGYARAVGAGKRRIWHAEFGHESSYKLARQVLSSQDRPEALLVLDDFMAMGVVQAARDMGIRIPTELGLASFNDSSLCQLVEGGLTSVNLNIGELVRTACGRLLQIIDEEPGAAPRRQLIESELRVRGSSQRRGAPVR